MVDARSLFSDLRVVIVDEIHAFAGDDRGWHLLSVLERISRLAGRELQRIGLSATVGNAEALVDWLAGSCHDANDLDEGIRDTVVLLQQGGFRTFTSCEGGRGHSFRHATIGIELEGPYSTFQRGLVRFLRSHGIENFTISLVTDYVRGGRSHGRRRVDRPRSR